MNLKKLWEVMPYKERQWPWGKMLKYITARQAQDKLDDVVWPENWKVEYKEVAGNIFAWVSIRVREEWITKWDAGSESNIEKEKGHISDSFKRACVCWGIGRFLYPESEATKPEFDTVALDKFKAHVENYQTADDAIIAIKWKYEVSKDMEDKITLLYNK